MFYVDFDNGQAVNAFTRGWRLIDMHVPDVETSNDKDTASGVPGSVFYGITVEDRNEIVLIFDAPFQQVMDYPSVRSGIYQAFNNGAGKLFMTWDRSDPAEGSLFLRVAKQSVEVERVGNKARAEVTFETVGLPYFETVSRRVSTYSNMANITYENQSDVDLDHRYTDTTYEVTFYGSASFFQITTDEVQWRYSGLLQSGDILKIADGTATLNGADVLEDTTMNIIKLKPGNNVLEILGSMEYTMKIKTKDYYY